MIASLKYDVSVTQLSTYKVLQATFGMTQSHLEERAWGGVETCLPLNKGYFSCLSASAPLSIKACWRSRSDGRGKRGETNEGQAEVLREKRDKTGREKRRKGGEG